MKDKYTHITIVLDKSGSMEIMSKNVIEGFNTLIDEQIEVDGEATLTLINFDTGYMVINDFVALKNVIKLNDKNFQPSGSTALLDAMGKSMNNIREKIELMKENDKPSKAIFVFITDGEENASKEYTRDRVFEMISDLKQEKEEGKIAWDFVFIGANQDAIKAGREYGIRDTASLTYTASGEGATLAFSSLSNGISKYRCSNNNYAFSEEDKNIQTIIQDKNNLI
jgi:uncharacterized protein YegL